MTGSEKPAMTEQQTERDIAEMEAQMAHDTDQYFEARPQIMRTRDKETTFEAGFKAAWKARALSHAEGEAVDWDDAQTVCDLPEVHDCLQCFSEDSTGDNGTEVVRAVMEATRPALPVAPVPWPKREDITEDMRAGFERLYREKAERDGRTLERNDQGAYAHLQVQADWIFYQRAWADALEATAPQVAVPEGLIQQLRACQSWIGADREDVEDDEIDLFKWDSLQKYIDLLAAAPTAPAGEPDDSDICEQVELPHVLAWADGIRGDMWTEYADRITDEEARVAQAVWAAHTGEQPVSDPDGLPSMEDYQSLCAALYQACGAYDMPERIMDVLSKAQPRPEPFRHLLGNLLPVVAPDEREVAARALEGMAKRLGGNRPKWASTACMKEVRRLRAGKEGEDHE